MADNPSLERLLGAVEQAVRDLDTTLKRVIDKQDAQDARISALERAKAWLGGVWFVVGGVLAYIAAKWNA